MSDSTIETEMGVPGPDRVTGTWDFKWPRGRRIVVAFQELHPVWGHDSRALIDKVVRCAARWSRADVAIRLELETSTLLPPPAEPRHSRSSVAGAQHPLEYDVAISFAPLPLEEPLRRGSRTITTAASQLGAYAKRADYGIPTTYIGQPLGFVCPAGCYFDSPAFEYTVVHELGHVLGLAHEHQNPRRRLAWKPWQAIQKLVHAELGMALDRAQIAAEITAPWPAARAGDRVTFSDWRDPDATPSASGIFLDSVMAYPIAEFALDGAPDAPPGGQLCWPTHPTAGDLEQLCRMYPRRPGRGASARSHAAREGRLA